MPALSRCWTRPGAGGASIVAGDRSDPPFFRAVVTEMSRGSRLWQDEIFAPIAPVLVVDDDEAVAVANDTG